MANKLAYYLRRTPAREVTVRFDQVAELIGEEKAHELAIFETQKSEIRKGRVGRRSAIPPSKRTDTFVHAGYKYQELLDAINEAQGEHFQASNPDQTFSPIPNVTLLPSRKRAELQQRGLVPS